MARQETPSLCIMILSVKSSGSSVLQSALARILSARLIRQTTHAENESLFWTKAASILGKDQVKMPNSEVPIAPPRAHRLLTSLVRDNVPDFEGGLTSEDGIFRAWTGLVHAGQGAFLEKSPHHLYQPAAIELMRRYADQVEGVDVRFIGLVRNPIDTLYSSWRRFGIRPEVEEAHWIRAYALLRDFQMERPDIVTVVRYEDLVCGRVALASLLGLPPQEYRAPAQAFHTRSIQKWRRDQGFGYRPGPALIELAKNYGYTREEVENPNAYDWRFRALPRAAAWWLFSFIPRSMQDGIKALVKPVLRRSR